jgi:hypothetical protein
MPILIAYWSKLVFVTLSHFHTGLTFAGKAGVYLSGDPATLKACHCFHIHFSLVFVGQTATLRVGS